MVGNFTLVCFFLTQSINIHLYDKGRKGTHLSNLSGPKGPSGPPSHENVIRQFGQSLTEEQRTSILAKISELQESRASFDEVKAIVDTFPGKMVSNPPSKQVTFINTVT